MPSSEKVFFISSFLSAMLPVLKFFSGGLNKSHAWLGGRVAVAKRWIDGWAWACETCGYWRRCVYAVGGAL